ncbi:unnamed protein product [Ceratitis capitata]|uniref:(Mediterranean fruit fly) hypothetical protein n=1 Tax=Ceratitis capitata TaxID=7213 RepID=A0A811UTF7_CERCA|nr:unnamed protein product [Ceratitis capitata]
MCSTASASSTSSTSSPHQLTQSKSDQNVAAVRAKCSQIDSSPSDRQIDTSPSVPAHSKSTMENFPVFCCCQAKANAAKVKQSQKAAVSCSKNRQPVAFGLTALCIYCCALNDDSYGGGGAVGVVCTPAPKMAAYFS